MASIGRIKIGGHSDSVQCGAAFTLSAPAPVSQLSVFECGDWEVELCKLQTAVVARSSARLEPQALNLQALEFVQRCLDQLSFARHESLLIKNARDEHVLLFKRGRTMGSTTFCSDPFRITDGDHCNCYER